MGDLQTGRDQARQGLAAGWGGSLLRGMANGVGLGSGLGGALAVQIWPKREERANEKKREKFLEEMRGERKNPEEISVCFGGVRADKKWFFNFYKVYSSLSFLKGYCTRCKKL